MSKDRVSAKLRRLVIKRAGGICEYCRTQARFSADPLSVEHVLPRARGGQTTAGNTALACQGCNGCKSTKTDGYDPVTKARVPLFHPRQQRWEDHFAWDDDKTHILGLTPTGRATVRELKMNKEGLVNQRAVLYQTGNHPPPSQDKRTP